MPIHKVHKTQTVTRHGCPQQNKCIFTSVTGGTSGKHIQSHVDGEVGCSIDVVQQQWMSNRPDLCEFLEPHTWRCWTIKVVVDRQKR